MREVKRVLNCCLLSCARTDEELGSLAIVNLLLSRTALSLQKKSKKKVLHRLGWRLLAKMHLTGFC